MTQPIPKTQGTIKIVNGTKKPVPNNPLLLRRVIDAFKDGDEVEIIIQKKKNRKPTSSSERKYYFGVVIPILISEYGFNEKSEAHEALKYKFLKEDIGNGFVFVPSIMALDTVKMEKYLSDIRQYFSMEHGVYIPQPNESYSE